MERVLIVASGSYGDVYPFIALGQTLQRRGQEVLLFTNPYFAHAVQAAGLTLVPVGTAAEYEQIAADPQLWHPRRGLRVILAALLAYLRPGYDALVAHYRPGQTRLVASTLAFSARLLQETHAAPLATVHLAPSIFRSAYHMPEMPGLTLPARLPRSLKTLFWWLVDRYALDPLYSNRLDAVRADLGLPPVRRVFHDWLHSPNLVIGLFPDWFAAPQPDWPAQTHLTGFPLYDEADPAGLPADVEAFLAAGSPPLVFTPGSAMRHGQDFFTESIAACERLGRRGILLTRYPEQIPAPLPASIRYVPFVPFSQLLPRCAAVVHHGGIGSCSQGLQAGIPQLVRALAYDQFDNAARLAELGVGRRLTVAQYRTERVAATLDGLLTEPVQRRCQAVAGRLRQTPDPLASSCDLILSLPL